LPRKRIYFCREDEVVFRKSVDCVRECGDLYIPPAKFDVGVMTFALGKRTDFVHEEERLSEVLEFETTIQFMPTFNFPLWRVLSQFLNFIRHEVRHAAFTGNTLFA